MVRLGKVNVERFVSFPTIRFAFFASTIRMPLFSHFSRAEEEEGEDLEVTRGHTVEARKKISKIKRSIIDAAKKFPRRSRSCAVLSSS